MSRRPITAKRPEPVLARQRTILTTLVDDWDEMTLEERRRVISVVFAEIHADADGVSRLLPRDDWKPYLQAVLRKPAALERCVTERRTGLYVRNVETNRLVRDERGWLRLAG